MMTDKPLSSAGQKPHGLYLVWQCRCPREMKRSRSIKRLRTTGRAQLTCLAP
jgi:hypothetical protein